MSTIVTARQTSARALAGIYAEDLVAQAVAAVAHAQQLQADAQRAVELIAGDLIAELTEAQAQYFGQVDHNDELWADVEIAEAALAPATEMADTLESLNHR